MAPTVSPRQPWKRGQEFLAAAFRGREAMGSDEMAEPGLLSPELFLVLGGRDMMLNRRRKKVTSLF